MDSIDWNFDESKAHMHWPNGVAVIGTLQPGGRPVVVVAWSVDDETIAMAVPAEAMESLAEKMATLARELVNAHVSRNN